MTSKSKIFYSDSRNLSQINSNSVNLIITSPPYPMIEMWDSVFSDMNPDIKILLESNQSNEAFELMHKELDKVWSECYRVLTDGGIACINIGDATRTIDSKFQLYSNHSRIITKCFEIGFSSLPSILWRKQTNAPNKFMGSGMLPVGAYVTLEHEYILILRKNSKRSFTSESEKIIRKSSAFFWEERNCWFSDIWDIKGIRQKIIDNKLRERSAAFPFELAYRLINMYSVKGDFILDPFLGTGTSLIASVASARNFYGIEIDSNFSNVIFNNVNNAKSEINNYINTRLNNHYNFILDYESKKGKTKYTNENYNFPVVTKQETNILINLIKDISMSDIEITTTYLDKPEYEFSNQLSLAL